jgi:hypothetical protein
MPQRPFSAKGPSFYQPIATPGVDAATGSLLQVRGYRFMATGSPGAGGPNDLSTRFAQVCSIADGMLVESHSELPE